MSNDKSSIKPPLWAPSYQEEFLTVNLHDKLCTKHGNKSGEPFPPEKWCNFHSDVWKEPTRQFWLQAVREIIRSVREADVQWKEKADA